MELKGATASHVGNVRENNQDRVHFQGFTGVVADGMGGHQGGEMAASIAIAEFTEVTAPIAPGGLVELVEGANRAVFEKAADPDLRGMGTTLVALTLRPDEAKICVVNVGDSRAYRLRDDELRQLTLDHSLVEDLVRQNRLTPSEALTHPQRNILTRALGIASEVEVDRFLEPARLGDRFLLCSDGLFNEVSEDDIVSLLQDWPEPNDAADRLVEAALGAAGRDNVTVAVIDIVSDGEGGEFSSEAAETLLVPAVSPRGGGGAAARSGGAGADGLGRGEQAGVAFGQTAVGIAEADIDPDDPGFGVASREFDPDVTALNGGHDDGVALDDDDADHRLQLDPDSEAAERDGAVDTSEIPVVEADGPPRGRIRKVFLAVFLLGVATGGVYVAINRWVDSQFFVDVAGDQITVFQGRPDGFLWTDPAPEFVPDSGGDFDRLTNDAQNQVRERRTFSSTVEAAEFIELLEREPVVTEQVLDDAAGTAVADELGVLAGEIKEDAEPENGAGSSGQAPATPSTSAGSSVDTPDQTSSTNPGN